jgi:hypothetical protein
LVAIVRVNFAMHASEQAQCLAAHHAGPEVGFARHIRQPTVKLRRATLNIEPENGGDAGRRRNQPQEQTNGGRLAGSVRAEVPQHLALHDIQVQIAERNLPSVALG